MAETPQMITGVPEELKIPTPEAATSAQAELITTVPGMGEAAVSGAVETVPVTETADTTSDSRRVPIPAGQFKGDPSRVPGHPSNPSTQLFQNLGGKAQG